MTRLEELRQRLAARTDGGGNPQPGYKGNVAALKAEIARLEPEVLDDLAAPGVEL